MQGCGRRGSGVVCGLLLLMAIGWVQVPGQAALPFVMLAPELAESLPLIGADAVHRLGITGQGVGVAVVDIFTPNPNDPCRSEHGAWVEGIVRGVAPGAKTVRFDVRAVPGGQPGGCFVMNSADINAALRQILDQHQALGLQVVNLSWGGGQFERPCSGVNGETAELIQALTRDGVMVVAAAGNEGLSQALVWPACLPEVISVGAVYDYQGTRPEVTPVCAQLARLDAVTCYSNGAAFLDLLAPGSRIEVPSGLSGLGTSAAAPHVTGVIALLRSAAPGLAPKEIRQTLRQTGRQVRDERNGLLFPRVDALAAVQAVLGKPPLKEEPQPDVLKGDVNLDGRVNGQDVLLLLSALGGLARLSDEQDFAADVALPCDRAPNLADLRRLKRVALGRAAIQCDPRPPRAELAARPPLSSPTVRTVVTPHGARFQLDGPGWTLARVQVFNLAGRRLFDSGPRTAQALRWELGNAAGQRVADGVYLALLQLRGSDGSRVTSWQKLAVLR